MPATAAQVFGPTTIDPGFNTTGEKTLLTMNTTLPAGGKNIIIATYLGTTGSAYYAGGTFRIKKGTTILYETKISPEYFLWTAIHPAVIIAIDDAPAGNDTYTFVANVTNAATSSNTVHVQAIVIKADDAVYAANTTAVSAANGQTVTVLSLNTDFPADSKVIVMGVLHAIITTPAQNTIGTGNIRLKAGSTVVASNQFPMGSYGAYLGIYLSLYVPLVFLHTASGPLTYSIEVYNNSGYNYSCYGMLVAFTVSDGAFLDTASVVLVNGSQVTVGNLTTTLQGDVVAIALAAAQNTGATGHVLVFNADDAVLQKDGSATGQVGNKRDWWLTGTTYPWASAGILPLFRYDENVMNPSYQVKMTARRSGINGEAKIVAFTVTVIEVKTVTDSISLSDAASVSSSFVVSDSFSLTEAYSSEGHIPVSDYLTLTDVIESPKTVLVTDSISLTDAIGPNELKVSDSIALIEAVGIEANIPASDYLSIADFAETAEPAREVADSIRLTDSVFIERNVQRIETSRRVLAPKRILPAERSTSPR